MKLRTKIVLHLGSTAFLAMTAVLLLAMVYTTLTLVNINEEGRRYAMEDLQLRARNALGHFQDVLSDNFLLCRTFFVSSPLDREEALRKIELKFADSLETDAVLFGACVRTAEGRISLSSLFSFQPGRGGMKTPGPDFPALRKSPEFLEFLVRGADKPSTRYLVLPETRDVWILSRVFNSDGTGQFLAIRLNQAFLSGILLASDAGYLLMQGGRILDESYSLRNRTVPEDVQKYMYAFCLRLREDRTDFIRTECLLGSDGRHSWFLTGMRADPAPDASGICLVRIYEYNNLMPELSRLIDRQVGNMIFSVILFLAVGIILLLVPLYLLSRQLGSPLVRAAAFADSVARGDFSTETGAAPSGINELDLLMKSLEHMRDHLNSMVGKLRRSHDRELAARKEAENSNKVKPDFLDTLAMEHREPLNAIAGFETLVEKQAAEGVAPSPADLLKILKAIRTNLDSLAEMGETLHELASLDNPRDSILNFSECETFQLIREFYEPFSAAAEKKHVSIELHYSSDLPERIHMDREKFLRMCTLLLSALVRAAPSRSALTLAVAREDGRFVLSCSGDDSNPLPLEYLLYNSSQRPLRGFAASGEIISLTLARHFAETLGAEFSVSCPDEKNFVVRVAFAPSDPSAASGGSDFMRNSAASRIRDNVREIRRKSRAAVRSDRPVRVLLAEDDDSQRLLLEMMLLSGHCEVASYPDIAQTRAAFDKQMPDVLIIDLHMRDLDRGGFISEIRQKAEGKKLCIILLAASLEDGERDRLVSAGANRCLLKPVDMDELMEAVRASSFT